MSVNHTPWRARCSARGNDDGIAVVHRFGGAIDEAASRRVDDSVHTEVAKKIPSCRVGQPLVDDQHCICRIPFTSHALGDRRRCGEIQSHEFTHAHSVGLAP